MEREHAFAIYKHICKLMANEESKNVMNKAIVSFFNMFSVFHLNTIQHLLYVSTIDDDHLMSLLDVYVKSPDAIYGPNK